MRRVVFDNMEHRKKLKKGQKSNFNPKKTKTRGNKCHSFVENKTRDAKR